MQSLWFTGVYFEGKPVNWALSTAPIVVRKNCAEQRNESTAKNADYTKSFYKVLTLNNYDFFLK